MDLLTDLESGMRQTTLRKYPWALLMCALALISVVAHAQNQEFPVYPKYQVMGVVYAPPGSASFVTYGNSTLVGSSHSMILNSTSDSVSSTSQSTGFSLFGFGDTTTTTTSNSWGTASTTNKTYAMQTTSGNAVTTMGPVSSALGVNHDNDIIYIWLNPVVISSVTNTTFPYALNWGGMKFNSCDLTDASDQVNFLQLMNGCDPNQYPYADIVGIPVWCLKNPYFPGQACAQWLPFTSRSWDLTPWGTDSNGVPLGPGLTLQDYSDILRADPFVTQTMASDSFTVGHYCHPTYGVNLDPNDTEVIPDSKTFPTNVLHSGSSWPGNFCGSTSSTMSRFDPYGTVQYPAPGPNGEPQTYTGSFTYSTTSSTGQSATTTSSYSYNQNTTSSFSFGASFAPLLGVAGAVFAQNLSAGFNFSFSNGNGYSYSSAQTNTTADSTGTTNSASYSITGPQASDNYTGPVTFNVYKDNVYGAFAFYSDEQRQLPPIELSLFAGQAPIGVSAITNFGTAQVGSTSSTQTITLTNNSPYPMTMVGPAVTFSDPGFQLVPGLDFCSNLQLQPNGTPPYACTVTVEFAPVVSDAPNTISASYPINAYLMASGTENITSWENILVTSTGTLVAGTATPAAATCTGITPYCNVGATLYPSTQNVTTQPNAYQFATEVAGSITAQTEVFKFTNYYSVAIGVSGTSATIGSGFTLSDPVDYTITADNCSGTTVSVLGTCQITLKYLPKSTGTLNSKITILGILNGFSTPLAFAGASGIVQSLGLSATGASMSLTLQVPSQTGECTANQTITNTSSFNLTGMAVTGTNSFGGSACTGTVPPNGSCQGSVFFNYGGQSCTACQNGLPCSCSYSGTLTVSGIENGSNVSTQANASCTIEFTGFAHIALNGAEQTKEVTKPATHGKGSVTVSGSVKHAFTGTRHLVLTIGGFKANVPYSSTSTSADVANTLESVANRSGSPVTATASGDQVHFTSKVTGKDGNIAFSVVGTSDFIGSPSTGSLTGGADATKTTEFDAGSLDTTVDSVIATVKWGKGSTASTIATAMASSLNTAGKGAFTAKASGDKVQIIPSNKSMPKPKVSATVKDNMGFSPASFDASTN